MALEFHFGFLPGKPAAEVADLAAAVEGLGFEGIWIADSQPLFRASCSSIIGSNEPPYELRSQASIPAGTAQIGPDMSRTERVAITPRPHCAFSVRLSCLHL